MELSIILPVYNAESYLRECIDSILGQSFRDFELIIINDSSSDSSGNICEFYAQKDSRIVLCHNSNNKGVSFSRNHGLSIAMGNLIMFIDSDDWLDEGYLEEMVTKSEADIVISSFIYENETQYVVPIIKKTYNTAELKQYLNDYSVQFTTPWGKIYKRSIICSANISFDENISHGEDTLFLYDYLLHVTSIETREVYGYHYRCNNYASLSNSNKSIEQYLIIINAINEKIEQLESQYGWQPKKEHLIITEYFLSRYIRQLHRDRIPIAKKVNALKIIASNKYVNSVLSDLKYLTKGKKRRLFDLCSTIGLYNLAVILLKTYKTI